MLREMVRDPAIIELNKFLYFIFNNLGNFLVPGGGIEPPTRGFSMRVTAG